MSHSTALLTKIQSLETMLHQPLLRNDSVTVEKLLHDDFEEIGRSGQRYNRRHTIAALQEETGQAPIYAENFKLSTIAEGVVLLTYNGWPLSSDDWDAQMLFFVNQGFRVVAHDRRGHGRSSQVSEGHDMDHYADDVAAVVKHLSVQGAMHVGHSTGGGEVVRYITRHGEDKVSKAVLISAVPPLMVKTDSNPQGTPKSVFDDFQAQLAANRAQFYYDVPAGPFYGYNRPGAKPLDAVIWNWWRQGMMGGAKAHYDGVVAFSQTDFTDDLKRISIPVLVIHGDDDQVVPYQDSGVLSAKLVKNGKLITYKGAPHGIPTTHADRVNSDLLAFVNS